MKTQKLFSAKWVQTKKLMIEDAACPKLRQSQKTAVNLLKDKKHVILKAPTGWGKSLVIIWLILYKLLKCPNLLCIIAVPQTLIGKGFVRDWKIRIGRKIMSWVVGENLCHVQACDTIQRLTDFLGRKNTSIGDRVLLCTHATLALTFKRLQKQGRLDRFKDLLLWIDEAHHIMNAQTVSGDTISNSMGALVKHCLGNGSHVGLATATYGRHDRCHIIPDALEKRFVQVHIPYDVYFKEVQPVATFEFNIACGNVMEALDPLFGKMRPTILYLAKRNSRYATGCKYTEVRQIIKGLSKRLKQPIRRTDVLIYVGDSRILDLVTEKGRDKRKEYLDNGGEADMIIALDTCKEGFDWPKAERSIIIGERHSIPEMIQMIGRLFRRSKGKTHAEVFQIMPAVVENRKSFKDWQNANLTVLFSAMLLEDVFVPVPINGLMARKTKRKAKDETLADLMPNTKMAQDIMRDFLVAAHQCGNYEKSWRMAPSILKRYEIPKGHQEAIWKRLWNRMNIVSSRMRGLRLDAPFELLKGVDMVGGLLMLTSGLCGVTTFEELRRAIGRETRTLEEWVVIAENLAAQNIPLQEAA